MKILVAVVQVIFAVLYFVFFWAVAHTSANKPWVRVFAWIGVVLTVVGALAALLFVFLGGKLPGSTDAAADAGGATA